MGHPDHLGSTIMPYCGVPGGTLHVDRTPINSGFWAHERLGNHLPWMLGGLAVIGGLTAGIVVWERRRRPRLTIDGRPRSEIR